MKVRICTGNACKNLFSKYIKKRILLDIEKFNLKGIEILETCCMGKCSKSPLVSIDNEIYTKTNPAIISKRIIEKINNKK